MVYICHAFYIHKKNSDTTIGVPAPSSNSYKTRNVFSVKKNAKYIYILKEREKSSWIPNSTIIIGEKYQLFLNAK